MAALVLAVGGIYGYSHTAGGYDGGQAEYMFVPYADFQLLRFPDKDQAMEKIRDLALLSDILPTGYHGAYTAGTTTGSTVYVAGAGPVGLMSAACARMLGAEQIFMVDHLDYRLAYAQQTYGVIPINFDVIDDPASAIIEPMAATAKMPLKSPRPKTRKLICSCAGWLSTRRRRWCCAARL